MWVVNGVDDIAIVVEAEEFVGVEVPGEIEDIITGGGVVEAEEVTGSVVTGGGVVVTERVAGRVINGVDDFVIVVEAEEVTGSVVTSGGVGVFSEVEKSVYSFSSVSLEVSLHSLESDLTE